MLRVVIDGVFGNGPAAVAIERLAGVGIEVKAREVAA